MGFLSVAGIYYQTTPDPVADETQEALTITVNSSSGSDTFTATLTTQAEVTARGAFATITAALSALPKTISHTITINVASGSYSTVTASGFKGAGRINIIGGYTASSLTTGPATGTAATGTTTTVIKNPGANWTAGNLQKKFMVLSSGGGSPSVRPILSNTTTDAVTHAVSGQTTTSVFTIGMPNVTGVTATITDCRCLIYFYGVQFTRASSADSRVYYDGCYFSTTNVDGALQSDYDRVLQVYNCLFDDVATIYALGTNIVEILYCEFYDGAATIINADRVTTEIDARSCTQEPLYIKDTRSADVGLAASNNSLGAAGAILHLDGVARCSTYGTGITGGTNTAAYGVEQENGGLFIATGVTLTGASGDLYQDGQAVTWATLALYGTYSWGRSSVVLASSVWDVINTNVKVNGALTIASDTSIGGRAINYYLQYNWLTDNVTAYAGGGQANATACGYTFTRITTCATTGDSVKLTGDAVIGADGPCVWCVVTNAGANSCDVYPATGGNIDGLGVNAPYALGVGKSAIFIANSATTWYSILIN